MQFLGEELDGALTTQKIRGETSRASNFTSTAAALHFHSKAGSTSRKGRTSVEPFCIFCECNGHWAQDCKALTDRNERIENLKSANRCILCLNLRFSKRGKVFCLRFKKGHHRSVCMEKKTTTSRASPTTSVSVGRVDISSPDRTYLQTARVCVTGPTSLSRLTFCLLDGGSQCSITARSVIYVLQIEVVDNRDLSVSPFETSPTAHCRRRFFHFNMSGTWTDASTSLTTFESTHPFSHHPAVPHDIKKLEHTRKLMLAFPPFDSEDLPIGILIDGDQYWEIDKDTSPIRLSPSVVLLPSKLGWVISGTRSVLTVISIMVNYVNYTRASSLPMTFVVSGT